MPFPSFDTFFVPIVHVLRKRGGSATIEELEDAVADEVNLSEEQRDEPHGNGPRTKFSYRLAWARTYLKKGGALDNSDRGVWHLTQNGYDMSDENIRRIKGIVQQKHRQARQDAPDLASEEADDATEAGETITTSWKERLLELLLRVEPSGFERICQRILRESGFVKVEVTGKSGDGGIDGTGVLRLNLLSFQVLFQCKRYRGSVGASTIRDFRGAMVGRADKGLVMTTGTFTSDARREATRDGAPAIDLVDGDTLCDLLKSLNIGVKIELIEQVYIDESGILSI